MRMMIVLLMLPLAACGNDRTFAADAPLSCVTREDVATHVVKVAGSPGTASAIIVKPYKLLTVRHVSERFHVFDGWRRIVIAQRNPHDPQHWRMAPRLVRVKQSFQVSASEDVDVWELGLPIEWNPRPISFRTTPLREHDRVLGVGYASGLFASASGHFRTDGPVTDSRSAYVRFKLENRREKIPLREGSSGGGIFDCEGKLVGLISRGQTWEFNWVEQFVFGQSNTFAVPVRSFADEIVR